MSVKASWLSSCPVKGTWIRTDGYGRFGDEWVNEQAPVVQTLDSAIRRINHYPADSVIGFPNTYPLDSDSAPLKNGFGYLLLKSLNSRCVFITF